jgi:acyl dehydratase
MPFPAERVGLELAIREKTVSEREILAYAAGLSAAEPAFLDDARSRPLRALPFQCVSLEWPGVLSLRERLIDRLPAEESRRGVHAVQDSHFHRTFSAGDRLVTSGRLISARSVRSGVLVVCKLSTIDATTGEPVITSWTSSVYRDVALDGEAKRVEEAPGLPDPGDKPISAVAEESVFHVPRQMPHVYSECADIWNPIHTERRVALAAGLPDIILHGTATWALAGLTVLRRYADSDVGQLKRLSGRFTGMVIPGEDIRVRHSAANKGVVSFEVLAADGKPALSQGVAVLS